VDAAPPAREALPIHFGEAELYLVAKQKATITDAFTLPAACDIIRLMPHGNAVVRNMHLSAYLPDGSVRSVVSFDDWNARWQEPLTFVKPLILPAGTRLFFRCNADNSADNPRNPHKPAQDVIPTFDDMDAMAQLDVLIAPVRPADAAALSAGITTRPPSMQVTKTDVPDLT
jgi:hypothetical protein